MWSLFFSNKTPRNSNSNEISSNPETCAEIFNNFFSDAVEDLDIDRALRMAWFILMILLKGLLRVSKIIRVFLGFYKKVLGNFSSSFDPISKSSIHNVINNLESSMWCSGYHVWLSPQRSGFESRSRRWIFIMIFHHTAVPCVNPTCHPDEVGKWVPV